MEIGRSGFNPVFNGNQTSKAQPRVQATSSAYAKAQGLDSEQKTVLDEIREKGFAAYAKELNDKKLEELRKKILEKMGLTEETLAQMSPEQQANINRMVDMEVRKLSTAEAELSKDKKEPLDLHSAENAVIAQPTSTQIDAAGVGIGPLLALQDVQQKAEQAEGQQGGKSENIAQSAERNVPS